MNFSGPFCFNVKKARVQTSPMHDNVKVGEMDRVSGSRCSLLDRPGRNHEGPPRSLLRLSQRDDTFWIHTVKLHVQLVSICCQRSPK